MVFQINKLSKAVAAANTFFLANPDHMEMKQNLDYYKMMAGVQEEDFKDLEARPHMVKANSFSDDVDACVLLASVSLQSDVLIVCNCCKVRSVY